MADAWRDDRLTMQTLRDVYANLNHAETAGWPAAAAPPPAAAREEARRRAERAVAGAVFELGLRQCSPKVIQGLLARGAAAGSPAAELTTEHIKSHLQKYRQHHDRSRQPFRDHFERCLRAPAAAPPPPACSDFRPRAQPGSLGPRDERDRFRCPAGCARTFDHAPAAAVHGKSCSGGSVEQGRPAPRRREALDAAVGRAPGVLSELAAARARLRRDVDAALAEHRLLSNELAALAPGPS